MNWKEFGRNCPWPTQGITWGFKGTQAWHCDFGWVAAGVFKASQWLHLKVKQSYKCWQPLTQHSVLFQKIWILSKTAVRSSNLSRYLCAGIQKEVHMIQVMHYVIQTTKAVRQDNQCPSWTFNYVSAKHNSKALSWHQPTALFCTVHG
jgi:hypothetical protein